MQPTEAISPVIKSRNYTVDIFRILGAFCVVALHSPLNELPNAIALGIRLGSRWAVPFIFLVTGYFVGQSTAEGKPGNYTKSLNSLLAIFVVANCVYCLFYLLDGNPATNIQPSFTGLLIGQSEHLWYIGASIFGLLILQYLVIRFSDRGLLIVALTAFGIVLAGLDYAGLTGLHIQQEAVRYITAVPFIAGGFLVARHPASVRYLSVGVCLALVVIGFLLESGEAITLYKLVGTSPHNQEMLVGTALMAFGLFCLSLAFVTPAPNVLAVAGRTYSLLIYLYHPLIIALLYSIVGLGKYSVYITWLSPLISFSVTLLALKLIERVSPTVFNMLSGH